MILDIFFFYSGFMFSITLWFLSNLGRKSSSPNESKYVDYINMWKTIKNLFIPYHRYESVWILLVSIFAFIVVPAFLLFCWWDNLNYKDME